MLAWHCLPSATQLPSLTCDMCCSLDSLIGDCLPDVALLAWLVVLAVQVNLFAESLSPLDVPHLQAKSRTRCFQMPADKGLRKKAGGTPSGQSATSQHVSLQVSHTNRKPAVALLTGCIPRRWALAMIEH